MRFSAFSVCLLLAACGLSLEEDADLISRVRQASDGGLDAGVELDDDGGERDDGGTGGANGTGNDGGGTAGGYMANDGGNGTVEWLNLGPPHNSWALDNAQYENSALLGSSLSPCEEDDFVAGAPGAPGIFLSQTEAIHDLVDASEDQFGPGGAVACLENGGWLAGGTIGLHGESGLLSPYTITALAPVKASAFHDIEALVAVGYDGGGKIYPMRNGFAGYHLSSEPLVHEQIAGFASALAVRDIFVAAGSPAEGAVHVYKVSLNDGVPVPVFVARVVPTHGQQNFGHAVAIGNVLPAPGPELLVAHSNGVTLYNLNRASLDASYEGINVLVTNSSAATNAFSLEVLPDGVGPGGLRLSHYLVGNAEQKMVHRCLGRQCQAWSFADAPQSFGTSVVSTEKLLVVGAPLAGAHGMIYAWAGFEPGLPGVVMECEVNEACGNDCFSGGTCRGGVVCVPPADTNPTCGGEGGGAGGGNGGEGGGDGEGGGNNAGGGDGEGGGDGNGEDGDGDGKPLGPVSFAAGCSTASGSALAVLLLLAARRRRWYFGVNGERSLRPLREVVDVSCARTGGPG